jgi:alkanesulfonate monooxygenase SsuD/methylene tetrahydromethanopterin reductase-like flavin-dependent oxidoreductase (luciferase family)
MAHTLTAVRGLLAGEPARLVHGTGARPLRLGVPPAPPVPLWAAALGPRTLQVAAELADGWFPAVLARDSLTDLFVRLRADAPHRPRPLTVAAGPLTVAGDDAGVARDTAASCIAWYVCAMGDVYAGSLTRSGYGAEVQAVRAANPRPAPGSGRIPAEAEVLLDQLTATGTPDRVQAQLAAWGEVADVVMVGLPPGVPWDTIEATLRAAAPHAHAPSVPATARGAR